MKKWMLLILVLLMTTGLALGLAACGGDTNVVDGGGSGDGDIVLTCYNCTDNGEPLVITSSGKAGVRLEIAPRKGYQFLGMTNALSNGQQMVSSDGIIMYELPGDTALYAQWAPLTYVKRFEVGEHGTLVDNEPLNITAGTAVGYLPEPEVDEGYQFLGWYSPSAGKLISNGSSVLNEYRVVDAANAPFWFEEEVLTAVIELIQYTVTLDYNDGSGKEETIQVGHGYPIGQLQPLADDTENNAEFGGWSVHSQLYQDYLQEESLQAVTEDVVIYAYWRFYRDVTFVAEDTTMTCRVYEDEQFVPPVPDIPGKTVEGWYTSELFNTRPVSDISYYSALDTYYGKTVWATYEVTYVTGDDQQLPKGSYTMRSELELPVLSRENATFIGWCRKEDLSDRPLTKIAAGNYGNITLYAKFEGDPKTVVLDAGEGSVKDRSVTLEYGASFTLPVPQRNGYAFMGWYADEAMTQPLTDENGVSLAVWSEVKNETTAYAKYLKKYYVSVNVSTPGAASYVLKPYYLAGETVELSVELSDEFILDGIYSGSGEECLSRTTSYSFTMPESNVALSVVFHRLGSIKLTLADPQYSGYVSCVGMAKEGDTVYLDYDESCEYEVSKLLVNGVPVDISKELCFVMPRADVTLEVHFGPKQVRNINVGDTGMVLYMHNGHYYAVIQRELSWEDAKAFCQFYGGHLVTITSQQEMKFINDLRTVTNMQQKRLWIGASDLRNSGVWEWVTGENFDFSFWAPGEPNGGSEHCAEIYVAETGEWNNHTANTGKYFICEWENSNAPQFGIVQEVTPYTGESISVNAYHYNGHYYALVPIGLNWENAERYCESIGGHLVTIGSEGENQFIAQMRKIYSPKNDLWLGGSDAEQEGVWKWVTGEAFGYTAWHSGEPNGGTSINYAQLYTSFAADPLTSWADESGNRTCYFVCEWDNIFSIGATYFGNYYNMIGSTAQFMEVLGGSKSTQGREYILTTDIDLTGLEWMPKDFSGLLDGGGYSIKGLKTSLFNSVSGEVKNVTLEADIQLTVGSSALYSGVLSGKLTKTAKVSDVTTKGSIVVTNINGNKEVYIGGLSGYADKGAEVKGCTNYANISSNVVNGDMGGIIGSSYMEIYADLVNYGDLNCPNVEYLGGIIGWSGTQCSFINCQNYGDVLGGRDAANIVAKADRGCTIKSCFGSGQLSGTNIHKYVAVGTVAYENLQPIEIYTLEQLLYIKYPIAEETYILMADIDLAGQEWVPVNFPAVLEGNGHTIKNLTVKQDSGNVAMFLKVTGTIKNLVLENLTVESTAQSGVIVGGICTELSGTLQNIEIKSGSVTGKESTVGGFVGKMTGGEISGCTNRASVTGQVAGDQNYGTGGFAGVASGGTIKNCVNYGTVSGGAYTGGIIGSSAWNSGLAISDLTNRGAVTASGNYCGGIVGYYERDYTYDILNLKNEAAITGVNNVGGLFGKLANENQDSTVATYTLTLAGLHNSGKVTASEDYAGGLAGYLSAYDYAYRYDGKIVVRMTDAVNTGDVTGQYYVGGMLGYGTTDAEESVIVSGSSCCKVTATAYVGGIAGQLETLNLTAPTNAGSTITATGAKVDGTVQYACVGGYVGSSSKSNITDAVNEVTITYKDYQCLGSYVGGICGSSSGTFTNCVNRADVIAPNSDCVGGIAGQANKTFTYTSSNLQNTGDITGKNQVGGIFGRVYNYNEDETIATYTMTLDKLNNSGTVTASGNYAGGLIGYLYAYDYRYRYDGQVVLLMTEAVNTGNVTGQYYVGGLLGYGYTDTAESKIVGGSSSCQITATAIVGGITGKLESINLLSPSNAGSTLTVTGTLTEGESKYAYIGGYLGYGINSDISDAVNDMPITYEGYRCQGSYVGGIAGRSSGTFTNCTNNGRVKAPNSDCVGGIAGCADKTYTYTSKNLKNTIKVNGKNQVGGIFGRVYNYNEDETIATYTMTLEGLNNSATVAATGNYAGGLIGYLYAYDYRYRYDGQVVLLMTEAVNTGNVTGQYYVGGLLGYGYTDTAASQIIGGSSSSQITATAIVGGIAGKLEAIHLISPSNAGSTLTVTGAMTEGDNKYAYIGGYLGYGISSNITDASNSVVISYESPLCLGNYVGGIAGRSSGTFIGCTNRAKVVALNSDYVGGIAGSADKSYTYTSSDLKNTAMITGKNQVGGIFGRVYNYNEDETVATYTMTLEKLSNTGIITANGDYAGGLVGYLYAADYRYRYDGKVTVYLSDSANFGSVTGTRYVGGILGYGYTDSTDSLMYSCTSSFYIDAGEDRGSIVGKAEGLVVN